MPLYSKSTETIHPHLRAKGLSQTSEQVYILSKK